MSTNMDTVAMNRDQAGDAGSRLAVAAGAALLVAGIALVTFILPAEFAVDPLGTGKMLGLLDLGVTGQQVQALENAKAAGAGAATLIVSQEKAPSEEAREFTLKPKEWVEYKYRLDKGESLLYSWKSTGPVSVEFHAEPDSGPKGYAQSYEKGTSSGASGTLVAPFNGIHGWYWENTGNQDVTVSLTSAGFYNMSHEFHDGQPTTNKMFQ